jgi:hypothetical protein
MRPDWRRRQWLWGPVAVGTVLGLMLAAQLASEAPAGDGGMRCPWAECDGEGGGARHRERLERATDALARGRQWFVQLEEFNHDETWVLKHLLCARPDGELGRRVDEERERLRRVEGMGRLLDRDTPGLTLTPEFLEARKGQVTTTLYLYMFMGAVLGEPETLARELLERYLAVPDLEEYLLTHQLFALVMWEELRGPLWGDLEVRRAHVVGRIAREHLEDAEFSDLYGERALILALFGGRRCPRDLPEWTDVMLAAQQPEGCWEDAKQQGALGREGCWSHASMLALAVVQAYVDCLEPHPEAVRFAPWRGPCGKEGPWPAR